VSVTVNFVVCGKDESGFQWTIPHMYPTIDDASHRADQEAMLEAEVWVEKITTYREIVHPEAAPTLPDPPLIPA
jgi:hypothetical protein